MGMLEGMVILVCLFILHAVRPRYNKAVHPLDIPDTPYSQSFHIRLWPLYRTWVFCCPRKGIYDLSAVVLPPLVFSAPKGDGYCGEDTAMAVWPLLLHGTGDTPCTAIGLSSVSGTQEALYGECLTLASLH